MSKNIKEILRVLKEDITSLENIRLKYYPEIDEVTFKEILSIDPTYREDKMGRYGKWLINLFKKGINVVSEAQEFKDQLDIFDKNKHKHNQEDRDIGKVESLQDLINLNARYEDKADKSDFELKAEQVDGVHVVGSSPNWEVYVPETYSASKYLRGQNAVWCTGRHNDDSYWKSYVVIGGKILYIFINKNNRDNKYQGAFTKEGQCTEFRDAQNSSVDFTLLLVENPELVTILKDDATLSKSPEVAQAEKFIKYKEEGKPFVVDKSIDTSNMPVAFKKVITKVDYKLNTLKDGLFEGFTALEEFKIPEGVTAIPDSCFLGCEALSKVEIPNSVREIGNISFTDCKSLKTLKIPEGEIVIGINAFAGCNDLRLKVKKGTKIKTKKINADFLRSHIDWE